MANLFFLDTEAFDHTQFDVLTLDGEEGISRPFRFEVTGKASDSLPFDLDGLGGRARLQLRLHDGTLRFIVGAIRSVRVDGHLGASRRLRFEVMPELWIAGERRRNRIFQDLSVPEIVGAILDGLGIKHDFRVQNVQASGVEVHPKRAYCVQYQESDIDFILRILADEGIFFLFESDERSSTMVFADNETIYQSIGPLPFAHDLSAKDDHVTEFASQHSVRAGSVMFRDYDFRRPRLNPTVIATAPIGRDAPASLEVYEFPGGYVDPARGKLRARSRLEELRRDAVVGTGSGTTRRLRPGASFALVGHPVAELDVPWAVTFVAHSGQAIGLDTPTGTVTYQCSFECVPASVPFLPQRASRRVVAAVETATVTGETSEEITVDPEGRVHVQFHWDRDGERNERSSCAIRVAQPWAGTGFGLWFAPRAGMEVVVSFVGGDPDQPLITGCVYNGEHPLPVKLPEHKTRSTIRTQSSPKGEGFNELRFEDLAGREQIFLHAQRDYDQTIRANHARQVGGNQTVTVGQDVVTRIGKDWTTTIGNDAVTTIGNDATTRIARDAETDVAGEYHLSADGSLFITAPG